MTNVETMNVLDMANRFAFVDITVHFDLFPGLGGHGFVQQEGRTKIVCGSGATWVWVGSIALPAAAKCYVEAETDISARVHVHTEAKS